MWTRFKVVASTIRYNPAIHNVNLPNAPSIETILVKQVTKYILTTNLNVSFASPYAPDA